MADTSGAERRKYIRVSADFTISLKYDATVIEYPAAFARDISTGGIGIEIAGQYPDSYEKLTHRSAPVTIRVEQEGAETLEFTAQVVWGHVDSEQAKAKDHFRIGLKFVDLDDTTKQKFSAFIEKKVNLALKQNAELRANRRTPPPGSVPSA